MIPCTVVEITRARYFVGPTASGSTAKTSDFPHESAPIHAGMLLWKALEVIEDVAGSLELVVVYALSYCFISYLCRSRAATGDLLLKVENKHLKNKLRRALLRNAFLSMKKARRWSRIGSYAMKTEEPAAQTVVPSHTRCLPVLEKQLDRDGSRLSRTHATGKTAHVRAVEARPHSLSSGSLYWSHVVERRRQDLWQERQTKTLVHARHSVRQELCATPVTGSTQVRSSTAWKKPCIPIGGSCPDMRKELTLRDETGKRAHAPRPSSVTYADILSSSPRT